MISVTFSILCFIKGLIERTLHLAEASYNCVKHRRWCALRKNVPSKGSEYASAQPQIFNQTLKWGEGAS